ncbi:protein of unknown function (plasmid) [Paraburkholderia kururiensis]
MSPHFARHGAPITLLHSRMQILASDSREKCVKSWHRNHQTVVEACGSNHQMLACGALRRRLPSKVTQRGGRFFRENCGHLFRRDSARVDVQVHQLDQRTPESFSPIVHGQFTLRSFNFAHAIE